MRSECERVNSVSEFGGALGFSPLTHLLVAVVTGQLLLDAGSPCTSPGAEIVLFLKTLRCRGLAPSPLLSPLLPQAPGSPQRSLSADCWFFDHICHFWGIWECTGVSMASSWGLD